MATSDCATLLPRFPVSRFPTPDEFLRLSLLDGVVAANQGILFDFLSLVVLTFKRHCMILHRSEGDNLLRCSC